MSRSLSQREIREAYSIPSELDGIISPKIVGDFQWTHYQDSRLYLRGLFDPRTTIESVERTERELWMYGSDCQDCDFGEKGTFEILRVGGQTPNWIDVFRLRLPWGGRRDFDLEIRYVAGDLDDRKPEEIISESNRTIRLLEKNLATLIQLM